MGQRDERVDAYIAGAAPFAQPILAHLRVLVHKACPGANETIKWGFPHFEYHGILCSMAAFKRHCAFGFWHGAMRTIAAENADHEAAMGQFGRIEQRSDLPGDGALTALIRKAASVNETGVKPPRAAPQVPKPPPAIPPDLAGALRADRGALAQFEAMSPSHQREYVDWIETAKREETRATRLATAIEWIAEGKSKEWKYRGR
jgi:hypothetical protein